MHPAEHLRTRHLTILLQDDQCILQCLQNVFRVYCNILLAHCSPGFSPFTITLSPRNICCPLLQVRKQSTYVHYIYKHQVLCPTWKRVLYKALDCCYRKSLLQDFVQHCTWSSYSHSVVEAEFLGLPYAAVKLVRLLGKSYFSDAFSPTSSWNYIII